MFRYPKQTWAFKTGESLRRLRTAKSLTQEDLADRAFLTKGFISQIERDITSPSISTFRDILDVLGVELAEFFKDVAQGNIGKGEAKILWAVSPPMF